MIYTHWNTVDAWWAMTRLKTRSMNNLPAWAGQIGSCCLPDNFSCHYPAQHGAHTEAASKVLYRKKPPFSPARFHAGFLCLAPVSQGRTAQSLDTLAPRDGSCSNSWI